ncbi:hypothetical protein [Herbaspirillum chlorophenolicum]|uniref:hypothetical protein n=1 Tax=Herbaspirillum chlorophenolicum TaxID=211589 RepID=UPI00067A8103|nr:hypothetical protein [Herbaspirillum chlorophenolicum]
MKIYYAFRVFFVSVEFLIATVALVTVSFFEKNVDVLVGMLNISSEIGKYFILLPGAVIVWVLKEGKDFLGSDKKLMNWPDYWRLKIHVFTAYIYVVIFFVMAALPEITKIGIASGLGLILFASGVIGCLWAAASLYFAQITAKEILNQEFQD